MRMHSRAILVRLLSLGLLVAPVLAEQTSGSDDHFNRGAQLQKKGDLQGARSAYEDALRLTPERVDVLSNLGFVYLQLEMAKESVESFSRALDLDPSLSAVRMYLGLAYFHGGEFEAAYRETERAAKELAGSPSAAALYPRALHLLGLCLLKLERLQEGIQTLEQAVGLNPGNFDAAYSLATAYIKNSQFENVERLLEGPLASANSAGVYMIRGALFNAQGDYQAALRELTVAKELDSQQLPTLHSRLGYAQLRLEDFSDAIKSFRRELQINPHDFDANAYLGWLCLKGLCPEENVYEEAEIRLSLALRQKPEDNGLRYLMGQVYQVTGRYSEALTMLEQVVESAPDHRQAHVLLAKAYARLRRMDEFRQEQAIIRRLTEQELEEDLKSPENYATEEDPFAGLPESSP